MGRRTFLTAATAGAGGVVAGAGAQALAASATAPSVAGKRVLIAIGEFSEALETYYMVYRLKEAGAVPVVASLTVKRLQLVVHDFEEGYESYTEKPGYQIPVDMSYNQVVPETFQGLLVPGGRGPEEIRLNKDLNKIVTYFMEKNLPVGAMCHGVMVIYTAVSIKGRPLTAYQGIKPDIELLGGKYLDQEVVVDKSLVTSRGWPDLPPFMAKYMELLGAVQE
jgi:protease I